MGTSRYTFLSESAADHIITESIASGTDHGAKILEIMRPREMSLSITAKRKEKRKKN